MSKPQWLKDKEGERQQKVFRLCKDCVHFTGTYIKETKHKDKEKCSVWECAIHQGCLNTIYSVCCDDYKLAE